VFSRSCLPASAVRVTGEVRNALTRVRLVKKYTSKNITLDMASPTTGFTSVNTPTAAPPIPTALPPPPASTGSKRKRDGQVKFYAVRIGKEPGVYHTWDECLNQVRGYPKATFKSFTTLAEAQSFVDADVTSTSGIGGKSVSALLGTPQKYYGVQVGRVPGVYTNWNDVLEQIRGWKGPKHRGFKTRIEAELFVKEGQRQQNGNGVSYHGLNGDTAMESIESGDGSIKKKSKKTNGGVKAERGSPGYYANEPVDYEPGEAPLDAEDDFDSSIILDHSTNGLRYKTAEEAARITYQAVRPVPSAPVRIYTDGSSLSNGQAAAIGGVGVYFGPGDQRNISEPLTGSRQTNQRAELTAILRALEVAPKDRKIIILSDSNYGIKCVSEWFIKWRQNSWQNASGKPVENRDLITKIIDVLEERQKMNAHRIAFADDESVEDDGKPPGPWEKGPAGVKFVWVKGHAKDAGNEAADGLATAGARDAKELIEADLD
jgi:ribonuclease HI